MSILTPTGKSVRLGAQTFQPLGSWPVTQTGGGRGSTGTAQPAVTVPTNVQGYYTRRTTTTPQLTDQIRDVKPGRQPNVN